MRAVNGIASPARTGPTSSAIAARGAAATSAAVRMETPGSGTAITAAPAPRLRIVLPSIMSNLPGGLPPPGQRRNVVPTLKAMRIDPVKTLKAD